MGGMNRIKAAAFPILFEIHFLVWATFGILGHKSPENKYWIITYLLNIGLAYLVFGLFTLKDIKKWVWGPASVIILIAATFIFYFLSPDFIFLVFGGYPTVLFFANLFFLIRYLRNPGLFGDFHIQQWNRTMIPMVILIILLVVATVEMFSDTPNGMWQLNIAFFWVGYYAYAENIIKRSNQTEQEIAKVRF